MAAGGGDCGIAVCPSQPQVELAAGFGAQELEAAPPHPQPEESGLAGALARPSGMGTEAVDLLPE